MMRHTCSLTILLLLVVRFPATAQQLPTELVLRGFSITAEVLKPATTRDASTYLGHTVLFLTARIRPLDGLELSAEISWARSRPLIDWFSLGGGGGVRLGSPRARTGNPRFGIRGPLGSPVWLRAGFRPMLLTTEPYTGSYYWLGDPAVATSLYRGGALVPNVHTYDLGLGFRPSRDPAGWFEGHLGLLLAHASARISTDAGAQAWMVEASMAVWQRTGVTEIGLGLFLRGMLGDPKIGSGSLPTGASLWLSGIRSWLGLRHQFTLFLVNPRHVATGTLVGLSYGAIIPLN